MNEGAPPAEGLVSAQMDSDFLILVLIAVVCILLSMFF